MNTNVHSMPSMSLPPQSTAHPAMFSKFHPQSTPVNSSSNQHNNFPLNQSQIYNNQMAQNSMPQMLANTMNQQYNFSQIQNPQSQNHLPYPHSLTTPCHSYYVMNNNPNSQPNLTINNNNTNYSNTASGYYAPPTEQMNPQYFFKQQQHHVN